MSGAAWAAVASSGYLLALAVWCFTRSQYHQGKSEVYQEFADTFSRNLPLYRMKNKRRVRLEAKANMLQLALIDPHIRDGLRDALVDADEHWASLDRLLPAKYDEVPA